MVVTGNDDPADQANRQRRWLELRTLQWGADGTRLLRPMASRNGPAPLDLLLLK